MIDSLAVMEGVNPQTINTYALQLISNEVRDRKTATSCEKLINQGTFGVIPDRMSIERSALLIDVLEIGKRKFTEFRHLCKLENLHFPTYSKITEYRSNIVLSSGIFYVRNEIEGVIGVSISYRRIVEQTIRRILQTIPSTNEIHFPINVKIVDGLDGSGSHKSYNQVQDIANFTKNYILFAFRVISILDSNNAELWCKDNPNSTSEIRPIALIARRKTKRVSNL